MSLWAKKSFSRGEYVWLLRDGERAGIVRYLYERRFPPPHLCSTIDDEFLVYDDEQLAQMSALEQLAAADHFAEQKLHTLQEREQRCNRAAYIYVAVVLAAIFIVCTTLLLGMNSMLQ